MRMGTPTRKQFLLLKGKPVVWHTIKTFLDSFEDMMIILVLPQTHLDAGDSSRRTNEVRFGEKWSGPGR